jgi:ferrochelatase
MNMPFDQAISAAASRPAGHPAIADGGVGVLLVNLGTPEAKTAASVRAYLAEFLADRRIVDYPRALWLPLLHGIILNVRPARTARAYAEIWRQDTNESPLRYFTRRQAERLAETLGPDIRVDWAMRYGAPSIRDRMSALIDGGARRILIVPLYPQYSATTTASVHDAVFDAMRSLEWQPALRLAPAFHDEPAYIAALKADAERQLNALPFQPERIVLSFHGLPQRYFDRGDPYHCHCAKTARLLREAMGWSAEFAPLAFQSRFGPGAWLSPSTDDTLVALAASGVRSVAVMTPGFVSDCVETLEEIAIRSRETFIEAGGADFAALACLNDGDGMIGLLQTLVRRETAGWRRTNGE